MNQKLKTLYETYWQAFEDNIWLNPDINSALPFLIYVPEKYETADFKIMFCGQETQGWGGELYDQTHIDIDRLRDIYNGFVNLRQGYNSPYWNLQKRIIQYFPSIGFIRNNIVKIGKKHNPGCDEKIYELTKINFPVFREEIQILKPDLIIFLSGNSAYDKKLEDSLGSFQIKNISLKIKFDEFEFEDSIMPKCIRIKHPRSIQQEGKYFETIQEIKEYISKVLQHK